MKYTTNALFFFSIINIVTSFPTFTQFNEVISDADLYTTNTIIGGAADAVETETEALKADAGKVENAVQAEGSNAVVLGVSSSSLDSIAGATNGAPNDVKPNSNSKSSALEENDVYLATSFKSKGKSSGSTYNYTTGPYNYTSGNNITSGASSVFKFQGFSKVEKVEFLPTIILGLAVMMAAILMQ